MAAEEVVGLLRTVLQIDRSDLASGLKLAGADADAFKAKMGAAMADVEKALGRPELAVKRLEATLRGDKLLASANRLTQSIVNVGGATKLTEAEQARANATLQKAIEKYKALGQEAPQAMKYVEAATRKAVVATTDAGKAVATVQQSSVTAQRGLSMFAGSLGSVAASLGVTLGVAALAGEIIHLGKEAITSAGHLSDMSAKTGLSTEFLQRMDFVAGQAGGSLDDFTNASFRLGVRLSSGSSSVNAAVEQLGLHLADLRRQSPEQQFMAIVNALARVSTEQERNRLGVDLFGKTYAQIASAVAQNMGEIAKQASVMSKEQVRAFDEMGDAIDRWMNKLKMAGIAFAGAPIVAADKNRRIKELMEQLQITGNDSRITPEQMDLVNAGKLDYLTVLENIRKQMDARDRARSGTAGDRAMSDTPKTQTAVEQLKALDAQLAKLTASQRAEIDALQALGKSQEYIEDKFGLTDGAMQRYTATQKKMTAAQKESANATEKQRQALEDFQDDFTKFTDKFESLIMGFPGSTPFEATPISAVSKLMGQGPFASNIIGPDPGFAGASMQSNELGRIDTSDLQHFELLADGTLVRFSELADTLDVIHKTLRQFPDTPFPSWQQAVGFLTQDIDAFARTTDGAFGAAMADLASFVNAVNVGLAGGANLQAGWSQFGMKGAANKYAGAAGMASGGLQVASGFMSATESGSDGSRVAKGALYGAQVGAQFGPYGMAIGAGVGAIGGAIRATQPSKEEKEARAAYAQWADQVVANFDQIATAQQKVEAGGERWKKVNIAVRDAYLATGRTADEAMRDLQRLNDTTRESAASVAKALQDINDALSEQQQDQDRVNSAMEKYGITLREAGRDFQQKTLTSNAKELIEDWRVLVDSGMDVATVNQHMAESMNQFLNDARATGVAIPSIMRPIIDSFAGQGLLFDEAGNQLTQLGVEGLNFQDIWTDGLDKIAVKLDQLIDKLIFFGAQMLGIDPRALTAAGDYTTANTPPAVRPIGFGVGTSNGHLVRLHRGGMILPRAHSGLFVGANWMSGLKHDEVPIIAQAGEAVMSRFATKMLGGQSGVNALNAGLPWRMPQIADPMASVYAAADSVSRPMSSSVPYQPIVNADSFNGKGGGVSAQFGDINIHVSGEQKSPREIAAEVIRQLPRALKHNGSGLETTMIRTVRGRV